MKLLRESSLKHLLLHLTGVIILSVAVVLSFFYLYLPGTTNHGETITVPDLVGISMEDLEKTLTDRNLRYEVNDSSYSEDHPPLTILKQYPKPGSKVKENRKIFISINRILPPTVPMPYLIDGTLKNAEAVLKSNELKLGQISYEPDMAHNVVLRQYYDDGEIDEGTRIPKGSRIDLIVGNGLGKTRFPTPNYIGRDFEEIKLLILGQSLVLGEVYYEGDSSNSNLIITKQSPNAGEEINVGDKVELWVAPSSETEDDGNASTSTRIIGDRKKT